MVTLEASSRRNNMSNEARMPPDANAEVPTTPPAAAVPEPQPVLTVNDEGTVSQRKMGKAGAPTRKGRTAARRKPEKKAPAARKAGKKMGGAKGRFKSTTETGRWKSAAKRTAGSKPTAAQKKTPKKAAARKQAPARKQARAKRATAR
jgi:hypothetical protein